MYIAVTGTPPSFELYEFLASALLKRVSHFPVPSRDVTDQTLSGREKTKLFPPRKSLVSDIPAGDGKTANSFLQCGLLLAGAI
jgi:hypothetical protein